MLESSPFIFNITFSRMSTKFCPACATQVSQKLWTAHVTGRKHKQRVNELKAQAAAKTSRPTSSSNGAAAEKRQLVDTSDDVSNVAKRLKLEEVTATNGKSTTSAALSSSNEYAFIPDGFFDNPVQNEKTEATIEKQKVLDAEYQKFMNELSAAEHEVATEDDVDTKVFTHERQMESIDTSMKYWKTLNELEKKKESILAARNQQQQQEEEEMEEVKDKEDDQQESDDDDVDDDEDYEGDNWRSRKIV